MLRLDQQINPIKHFTEKQIERKFFWCCIPEVVRHQRIDPVRIANIEAERQLEEVFK